MPMIVPASWAPSSCGAHADERAQLGERRDAARRRRWRRRRATFVDGLRALDERVGAEDLLEAAETGLSLLGLGLDRLGRDAEADLRDVGDDAGDGSRRSATGATDRPTSLSDAEDHGADRRRAARRRARRRRAASMSCIASWQWPTMLGPVAASVKSPASRTTAPLRSADLATWPFLRASSRFLGVAFSVLSARGHAAHATFSVWRAWRTERCSSSASQPPTNGSVTPMSRRPTIDLRGEADGEDVELRHDAGDDAERGVGEDQREDDRPGDLDRAEEDRGERLRRRRRPACRWPASGRCRRRS